MRKQRRVEQLTLNITAFTPFITSPTHSTITLAIPKHLNEKLTVLLKNRGTMKNNTKSTYKQNALGALETALFLKKGAKRFSSDNKSLKQSFLLPILLLPMTLITVFYAHPDGQLADGATQILAIIYTLRLFIYLGLFLGLVYVMTKTMDRAENFKRFATANNWLTLPAACAMLPLLLLFLNGSHSWAEIYPMMVIVTLYAYAYTAFMATYVLRIPYELAGFIAIAGMAIHQSSLTALKWAALQTIHLIS